MATRLREALQESGLSQREFARRVVARTDGPDAGDRRVENERRQIAKYLQGRHAPETERAHLYAELLGKPTDYFIDAKPTRPIDLMIELRELVAALTALIEAQDLAVRLGSVEAGLARTAKATSDALSRLEAATAELSERLPARAPRPRRKDQGNP